MLIKEIKQVASLFGQATGYPVPLCGSLIFPNDKTLTVESRWSQRDIERKEKTVLERTHVVNLAKGKVLSRSGPQEVNNEVWNKPSPSGNLRVVVRSGKDKKNEDKQYLEIYDKTKKLKTVDVLALEKHGKIINDDGQFGSLEWSSSGDHLLYVAEKKKPKSTSFFKSKGATGDDDDDDDDKKEENPGCEFEYFESWGEQLVEQHHPVICVMDVESGVVSVLENVEDNMSPGQAMWGPEDEGVVFCAWDHEPYRLGLKHCCQRRGGLFYLDIKKGTVERLSAEDRPARFPRFSPDMSRLIYFDNPLGGAHHQCCRLVMIDWAMRTTKVVVDTVRHAPDSSFQGIFTAGLPRNIWFEDSIHLSLTTAWRSETTVVIVNTDTGKVEQVRKDKSQESMELLCVEKTMMLMCSSSLTSPHYLVVAHLEDSGVLDGARWFYPDGTPDKLEWIASWEVLKHKPTSDRKSSNNANLDYESILCLPPKNEDGSLPPLIVFVHGGPHVAFDTSYNPTTNFFCLCGYAVLMINYRGSWGFGQDNIESLLGHVGDQDVKDVETAMVNVVAKGSVDGNKVLVFGGSHGGFLTTHLIGQYPKSFKAASTRNPVINLVSMWSTTDIRDWIFVEAGLPFDMASLADEKVLPELWKRSPISHVNQVTTPVLLLIGLEDKRVPPSQGMEYYKALKARNVPVRCLTYPSSNHGLSEVDVEGDSIVNTIVWFNTYI